MKTVKVLLRLFWSQSDVRPITVCIRPIQLRRHIFRLLTYQQPSTPGIPTQSGASGAVNLRYLRDTPHNTNNLVPVMLCQYRRTQDRCCYYFVISTFRSSWRTSVIPVPPECQLTTGQSGKSSEFVTADRKQWWIREVSVHRAAACRDGAWEVEWHGSCPRSSCRY